MTNYTNPVNDWLVISEYYDSGEIIGLFKNTSIIDVIKSLKTSNRNYTIYSTTQLEKIKEDHLEDSNITKTPKKCVNSISFIDQTMADKMFDPKLLREHGISHTGYMVTVNDKLDTIKNKLSKHELKAIEDAVRRELESK